MRRRELLAIVASAAAWLPLSAYAERANRERPLLVWYTSGLPTLPNRFLSVLLAGLSDLGMAEGRDFDVDYRNANNRPELMPALAAEVVGLQPDLIIAGSADAALEAKKLATTIPIISGALADAIQLGLVESYAHPGGNVTGITPYLPDLPAKQMEIVRDVIPGVKKVGLLGNLSDVKAVPQHEELVTAAKKFGIAVAFRDLHGPEEIEPAIRSLESEKVDVVIVLQ